MSPKRDSIQQKRLFRTGFALHFGLFCFQQHLILPLIRHKAGLPAPMAFCHVRFALKNIAKVPATPQKLFI